MILVDGALGAYLARGDRQLIAYLPDAEPQRSRAGRAVARALIERARAGGESPRGMLIEEIDGAPPAEHPLARIWPKRDSSRARWDFRRRLGETAEFEESKDVRI